MKIHRFGYYWLDTWVLANVFNWRRRIFVASTSICRTIRADASMIR